MNNTYYVYFYKNPLKNNEIFYIGYGNHNRKCCSRERMYDHIFEYKKGVISNNKHKYYTLKQIYNNGKEPIVEIVKDNLIKSDAIKLETKLISLNKQTVVNITSGGDGGDTFTNQPEWKKKIIRRKLKNKIPTKHSKEWLDALSKERIGEGNPFYGKKHTKSVRDKCGAVWRGKKIPLELKKKRAHFTIYHVKLPSGDMKIFNGRLEFELFFRNMNKFLKRQDKISWQFLLKNRECKKYIIEKTEIGKYEKYKTDIKKTHLKL